MIGMAGQNRDRPIELLGKHCAHKEVRPSLRAEGEREPRTALDLRWQSIRTTDDEQHARMALIAPLGELTRKGFARQRLAALVERDDKGRGRARLHHLLRFALVCLAERER